MKAGHYLLILFIFLVTVWFVWSHTGRNYPAPAPPALPAVMQTVMLDSACTRNVVAIQPWMEPADYLSEQHFYEKLKTYFTRARQKGYFNRHTVVLLPEYLATWLVIAGEKKSIAVSRTVNAALTTLILSNFPSFVRYWLQFNPEKQTEIALFRMKATQMARIYAAVFRRLASEFQVTIVAGSIVLPDPSVFKNEITVHLTGELYNTSFVFYPDGSIDPKVVKKTYLTSDEQSFTASCPVKQLPVFQTGIGHVAVLICADSWFPEAYKEAAKKDARIILVPSYAAGNGKMAEPWRGYDGQPAPADVNPSDIGTLTEAEAWKKYTLPGRMKAPAELGVNVFLRGTFWNMGSDGLTQIVYRGKPAEVIQSQQDGIWNICF